MKENSLKILRLGLSLTFIWIGILILKDPASWGLYTKAWARDIIPFAIKDVMVFVGMLDIAIGISFAFNFFVFFSSIIASLHLVIILIVSGINSITVRDIGILTGTLALFVSNYYKKFK